MNVYTAAILSVIIGYLLGSIPSAYIVVRAFKGIDIRKAGSGNMGAMNAIYKAGVGPGILVGAADVGKGILSVYLGTLFCQVAQVPPLALMIVQMLSGLAAIAGHNYPVYFGFHRGGRGGATGIGVLFYMIPLGIPFFILLLLIVLGITRYLTISYAFGFVAFPVIVVVQWVTGIDSLIQTSVPWLAWTHSRAADSTQNILLIVFWVIVVAIPVLMYIPRIKEIMSKSGGSFRKAAVHHSVKERP